jgi:hypothetical protein
VQERGALVKVYKDLYMKDIYREETIPMILQLISRQIPCPLSRNQKEKSTKTKGNPVTLWKINLVIYLQLIPSLIVNNITDERFHNWLLIETRDILVISLT